MLKEVLIAILLLVPSMAHSDEFHLIDLDTVDIDYTKLGAGGRWPLITDVNPNTYPDQMLNLDVNTTLLKYGFFNNTIHSMTDNNLVGQGQFRIIGWEFHLGVHVSDYLDVGLYHYSQHVLDESYPIGNPSITGIEFKLFLYRKDKGNGIF